MKGEATLERPWLRSWPQGVPKSIDYPEISVHELLRRAANEFGDRPAITFYGKSTSFRDLDAAVDRFAAGLRVIGVRPGDRVSLVLPNTPHFVVAFFAVLRAGAIVVQTNPLYTPRELESLWTDAGVETVIALDLFWHNVSKARMNASVKRIVVCDVGEFLKVPLRQLYPIKKRRDLKKQGHWPLVIPPGPGIHPFTDIARTPARDRRDPQVDQQDEAESLPRRPDDVHRDPPAPEAREVRPPFDPRLHLRGRAPSERGAQAVRIGDGWATRRGIRADGGVARHPLQSDERRREGVHRHPVPRHGRKDRRRGRPVAGPPARRRRRTRRARSPGNERVLAQAGGNGHGPPERMVAHGRHRPDGRGRLLLHRRPQEGHDPLLRIQRVSAGGRRGPLHASGRGGSRGHRGAGQVPRRVGQGVRGPEERKGRDAGGNHRILQGAPRGIQGPEIRRVRDRPSDVPRGQGLATAAARARAREVESRRFGLKANGSTEPNRHFGSVEEPTQVLRLVAHRGADGRGERTERFDSNLKSAARALVGPDGRHPAVDKHDRGEPPLWTIYARVVGTFDEVEVVLLAQEEGVEGWQESDDRNVELRFPQCRKVFAKHPGGLSVDIDGRQLRLQARPDVAGVRGPQSNPDVEVLQGRGSVRPQVPPEKFELCFLRRQIVPVGKPFLWADERRLAIADRTETGLAPGARQEDDPVKREHRAPDPESGRGRRVPPSTARLLDDLDSERGADPLRNLGARAWSIQGLPHRPDESVDRVGWDLGAGHPGDPARVPPGAAPQEHREIPGRDEVERAPNAPGLHERSVSPQRLLDVGQAKAAGPCPQRDLRSAQQLGLCATHVTRGLDEARGRCLVDEVMTREPEGRDLFSRYGDCVDNRRSSSHRRVGHSWFLR